MEQLLAQVAETWSDAGVLPELQQLVDEVWRSNLDRHEPALGDDAQVLGLQSSLNLRNRVVRLFKGRPGMDASVVNNALRLEHAGRLLRISKAPGGNPEWDVHAMDWAQSDTRLAGARANTGAYVEIAGTLFENDGGGWPPPDVLRHLHLVWLGEPNTGRTMSWVGFPRLGTNPWFAVLPLDDAAATRDPAAPTTAPQRASFDELDIAPVSLSLRRPNKSARGPS